MAYRQASISSRKSGVGINFKVDVQAMNREIERVISKIANQDLPRGMEIGLRDFAELVAQDIRENAPAQHLRENVYVEKVQVNGAGNYLAVVKVDTPDARAWEFGSGIHATKGEAGKYLIKPKNAKMLSFYWKEQGRWAVLPRVHHPGIKAKPYVAPAVRRQLRRINTLIIGGIRSAK